MTGVFVAVVGPSGAGKDTLISGARERLAADGRFVFPRRVVTRETSRFEDHDTVSPERFMELEAKGAFALSWGAHGLRYGVPAAVHGELGYGRAVICNLSRGALVPDIVNTVAITAIQAQSLPAPEVNTQSQERP